MSGFPTLDKYDCIRQITFVIFHKYSEGKRSFILGKEANPFYNLGIYGGFT